MQKNLISALLGLLLLLGTAQAQELRPSDRLLLEQHYAHIQHHQQEQAATKGDFYLKGQSWKKKLNPLNWIFGGLLYVYQNTISAQLSAGCLYGPSCSSFSKQALRRYSLPKGLLLTADRITRCNRIAETGLHPIRFDEQHRYFEDSIGRYK